MFLCLATDPITTVTLTDPPTTTMVRVVRRTRLPTAILIANKGTAPVYAIGSSVPETPL